MKHTAKFYFFSFYIFGNLLFCITSLSAEEIPIWSIGLGGGLVKIPHYIGSDHYHQNIVFFPFGSVINGKVEVQSNSINVYIIGNDTYALKLEFNGSLAVRSAKPSQTAPKKYRRGEDFYSNINYTRRGMDNLPLIVGGGITASFNFTKNFNFNLPIIYNISAINYKPVGNRIKPQLFYHILPSNPEKPARVYISYQLDYGLKNYNKYFYSVNNKDIILPNRPAYDASAGIISENIGVFFSYRISSVVSFFTVTNYYSLGNSAIKNSPLVNQKEFYTAFLGFGFNIIESDEKTELEGILDDIK